MSVCTITGTLKRPDDLPFEGAVLYFVVANIPAVSSTGYGISPLPVQTITTSSGYFSIDLMRNTDFVVTIPLLGFRQKVRIPDAPTINLFEYISGVPVDDPTPAPTPIDPSW